MAGVPLEKFIATENGKFSLSRPVAGYVTDSKLNPEVLSWYRLFARNRAAEFIFGDEIADFNSHQMLDLLIYCRNALRNGGSLTFDLNLDRHRADIQQRLEAALTAIGLAVQTLIAPCTDGSFVDYRPLVARPKLPGDGIPMMRRLLIAGIKISDQHHGSNGTTEKVYVVGDSHVWFLSGRDRKENQRMIAHGIGKFENLAGHFVGFHLGPSIAFNLGQYNSTTNGTEKIEYLLENNSIIQNKANILFSFGEIDCRFHVCKQAAASGKDINEIVDKIIVNYIRFVEKIQAKGFRPLIWGPVAPTWDDMYQNSLYPVFGNFAQRKAAGRRFTDRLSHECFLRNIPFISIFDELLGDDGVTCSAFYADSIHLSQSARPFLWKKFESTTGIQGINFTR